MGCAGSWFVTRWPFAGRRRGDDAAGPSAALHERQTDDHGEQDKDDEADDEQGHRYLRSRGWSLWQAGPRRRHAGPLRVPVAYHGGTSTRVHARLRNDPDQCRGSLPGRLAQRKSTRFTPERSGVRIPQRPPPQRPRTRAVTRRTRAWPPPPCPDRINIAWHSERRPSGEVTTRPFGHILRRASCMTTPSTLNRAAGVAPVCG